jgi:hypothetical protein
MRGGVVVKDHKENVMRLRRVFGVIVAVGSLAATAVVAQDGGTASGASDAKASTKSKARKRAAKSRQPTKYGDVVNGPATTDAQGVPVAKPNPLSREQEEGVLGGIGTIPGELTDDSNVSGAAKSSDTKQ